MAIRIADSGIQSHNGQIQYVWFKVHDLETGQTFFRAVALAELAAIPVSVREDYDLMQKQWAAVRGLYNAQADYIYSAAGIFTPRHVGIVQFYGGAGVGENREESAQLALRNLAAVKATLANYEQSRLAAPNPDWIEWYLEFVTRRSSNIMALLGHPDPRQTRRGLGKDGELPSNTDDDLAAEQNELLFRGLAKLREDFIFQVTSERVSRKRLAEVLVQVAQLTSNVASRQRGNLSIGFSLSIPLAMALSHAVSGGKAGSVSQAHSSSDGVSHGWGQSHTESTGHSESQSTTVGGSETVSQGHGSTQSQGHSDSSGHTDSRSHTDSQSHSDSQSVTQSEGTSSGHSSGQGGGSSWSNGESSNWSQGTSQGASQGTSHNEGTSINAGGSTSDANNWSNSASQADSHSTGATSSDSFGGSVGAGVPGVVSGSVTGSHSDGTSATTGHTDGSSSSTGGSSSTGSNWGVSNSVGDGSSASTSQGSSQSSGGGTSSSVGGSSSWSESDSVSHSSGTATSHGSADSRGSADGTGSADSRSSADSTGTAQSQTESRSTSSSWATSHGSADSWGKADGNSESWGKSRSEGEAVGQSIGRSASTGWGSGMSTGLVPGISIGRSWQAEDDLAIRLTELLRQFEGQLNTASAEGGFMTTALIFTASDNGEAAARALVPQAFHGPGVPTPVLTIQPKGQEAQDIRDHALAFLHYPGAEENDPLGGHLFTRFSSLLTPGQNAAYTAPGLFEEGTAMTVMSPIPKGMAFYPTLPGNVLIGHQYSPETAELTNAPVMLDEPRLMHTMFAGDTGWGKSVAAIMMAYESTLRWRTRTVVLDFGAGWRQLLNAPGLEDHLNILQLWPDAVRPFRWNPLQIGRQINPETQWRAFADIFGSIAKLGVKRQKQELLDALRHIYVDAGVLVDDKVVREDPVVNKVRDTVEEALTGAPIGTLLGDLSREQRQYLAVHRSSSVGLSDLYAEVERKRNDTSPRDTMLQGVLDGILFRLNPLVQGSAAQQFAAGPGAVPLEDLSRPWGITVIEGGIFLDDFGKAFLLGWAGWHLYTDMVARRVHEITGGEPLLQIFFEEANKVFGGVGDSGGDDESGGVSTSQRFADMFRDARKYKCRLHVVTQAPSLIPQDIISSCNNLVIGFLKQPKDKDIVLSALARSERGFHDEEWRRFLTNENIGMAIGRFPYTTSRELQQPFLFKPLMLTVAEPTDAEIAQRLGMLSL